MGSLYRNCNLLVFLSKRYLPYSLSDVVVVIKSQDETMDDTIHRHLQSITAVVAITITQIDDSSDDDDDDNRIDNNNQLVAKHHVLPRAKRVKMQHGEALHCILHDYLGPTPIFDGKEFDAMFRISRHHYELICQKLVPMDLTFYASQSDCVGRESSSLHSKVLLPLKCLAFGVAPHAFCDYFQMSKTLACEAYLLFTKYINEIFKGKYLRLPTKSDAGNILRLHESVHGIAGMMGSLDCMHVLWKNCPKAYQGAFQGKEKSPL